jgi:hypothetical protein
VKIASRYLVRFLNPFGHFGETAVTLRTADAFTHTIVVVFAGCTIGTVVVVVVVVSGAFGATVRVTVANH